MNRIACALIAIALFATPSLFAQGTPAKARHAAYAVSTNLTVSGVLRMMTGVVPESTATNRHVVPMYATNQVPATQKGDGRMTIYCLDQTDGTKAIIPDTVADASPFKLSARLGESVTIVGTGTVSGEGAYKRIHIIKITSITKNAAASTPAKPAENGG